MFTPPPCHFARAFFNLQSLWCDNHQQHYPRHAEMELKDIGSNSATRSEGRKTNRYLEILKLK